jgi:hypothetical protein
MAEENYTPNGWLGLQLGKSIWIPCWNLLLAEQNLLQLLKSAKIEAAAKPVIPPIGGNGSVSAEGNASDSDAVKALQRELDVTRLLFASQLAAMKEEFKVQLAAVTTKLDSALKAVEELKAKSNTQ